MKKDTSGKDNKDIIHKGFKSIRINKTQMEYESSLTDKKHFKERLNFNIKKSSGVISCRN